jgi:hypothetical protein
MYPSWTAIQAVQVGEGSAMHTQHLSFEISFTELARFFDHWSSRYQDPRQRDGEFYDPNIGKGDALRTEWEALQALFIWKNGTEISPGKLNSIRKNYFNNWTEDANLESRFLNPNKSGGPIWNIFYLHCRFPDRYPIYDQHAHRAMIYIQTGAICEDDLSSDPKLVYECYQQYRPFVESVRLHGCHDMRKIDRALYTFGQFLKKAKSVTDSMGRHVSVNPPTIHAIHAAAAPVW